MSRAKSKGIFAENELRATSQHTCTSGLPLALFCVAFLFSLKKSPRNLSLAQILLQVRDGKQPLFVGKKKENWRPCNRVIVGLGISGALGVLSRTHVSAHLLKGTFHHSSTGNQDLCLQCFAEIGKHRMLD